MAISETERITPYLDAICLAADEQGLPRVRREVLAAVALRETCAGYAPGYTPRGTHLGWGDSGHGWGLWQADDRTWEAWILTPEALTAIGQARQAARKIAANLRILSAAFPALPAATLELAAICGYNARLGAVAGQLAAGADPNAVTTRGPSGRPDYGDDVLAIAERLRRGDPLHFPQH